MDVRSDIVPGSPDGFHLRDVSVRLARPDERTRWDVLMNQHHYLGFKRIAGRGWRFYPDFQNLRQTFQNEFTTAFVEQCHQPATLGDLLFRVTTISIYTHRTESTSVETVVAFKAPLIRLSRTAQWQQPH